MVAEGQVYEVLVRNKRGKTKIADEAIALQIKNVTIESGTLIFEGIKLVPNSDTSKPHDQVTYTKVDQQIEALDILAGTFGALRAVPSTTSPGTQPKGSFGIFEKASGNLIGEFSYPWEGSPTKKIGNFVAQEESDDTLLYTSGNFDVSAERFIQKAKYPEVLIVGSGPLGATYARKIIEADHEVLMVEMGAQESSVVGRHKKNAVGFQKDIDSFVNVIKGDLSTLSVPVRERYTATLSPISWNHSKAFTRNGQNPDQKEFDNLGAAAATRCVGGMGTHWTCATPRQHKTLERSTIFTNDEWETLYDEAERYLGTSRDQFQPYSIRDQLVKSKLEKSFDVLFPNPDPEKKRKVLSLPLACKRNTDTNPDFVTWAASDTILGETVNSEKFHLMSEHQCTKVLYDDNSKNVVCATIKNIAGKGRFYVFAKKYVICGGSVLTPQILFNSGFRPVEGSLPALGHYLTEQTMSFCQIILKDEFVQEVENTTNPEWKKKVDAHRLKHPEDPLPFPYNDPDPQLTTPVTDDHPWHTQIHRDAFSYGEVAQSLDSRLVVDFRFFGMVDIVKDNRVEFSTHIRDHFHMPQPTFHFTLGEGDCERSHRMMQDMCTVATQVGGYLPGSEPQFMEPGLALHICGTTRAGADDKDSVVDKFSKVHNTTNLYLGGNNVIPTRNACNPTLTSMCFAIKGAEQLISEL
ncbi:pyranose oxidase [Morchella conica CCBAS932]|uniref:Pyranose 2-oxidase n=1 Tax=Morchella conica CCBAS932 TaxID=1392247 RepID=A0A3N4KCU7_9PEZI|nr:pyranose oxidase [Morchella conica CCBAS932]